MSDRPSAPSISRLRADLVRDEILGVINPGERVDYDAVFLRLEGRVEALTFEALERELEALRELGKLDLVSSGIYQRRDP